MCETSSSLTFPVHAIASAHNRRMLSFYNYFMDTIKIDVDDIHGVGWQGVHSGCLAGGYLSVVYGLFGMRTAGGKLGFLPNPSPDFEKVSATVKFKGREISVRMGGGEFSLKLVSGKSIKLTVRGREFELTDSIKVKLG